MCKSNDVYVARGGSAPQTAADQQNSRDAQSENHIVSLSICQDRFGDYLPKDRTLNVGNQLKC